jgi:membrane peptidoglycan carboxypeptidase
VLTSGVFGRISIVARLLIVSAVGGALVAALALPAVGVLGVVVRNGATNFNRLPTPELGKLPVRSEILDRYGHVLAYYYPRGIDRVPVSYKQIAPHMRDAIVAIEDSRFYKHGAIDFKGTIRALVNNLEHKPVQGGSTLAQQYVKNVEILSSPNPQKAALSATADTLGRKIRELRMAVRAERSMSKNQILAGYLNVAYFGNQSYGIQTAAHRYFSISAAKLSVRQAALLAGMVENPTAYNPVLHKSAARERRNIVLARMAELGYITNAQAARDEQKPLGLRQSAPQSGCTSRSAKYAGYFCDYVVAKIRHDKAYQRVWSQLNWLGGLKIYTTLDPRDQRAANHAVNYQVPPPPSDINPARNADTEVMVQPGTGEVRAIGIDRPYGTGPHQNTLNYAVGPQYDGSIGAQIGSTGKVYVMVTALLQGIPFGYSKNVGFSADVTGYTNCKGQPVGQRLADGQIGWHVHNDESERGGHYTLYTGTTFSINVFFAYLEQKVGLCNTVRTASRMGLTWPDGRSLLQPDRKEGHDAGADSNPSFTLGADNVAPIDVAAADATLPARGIFCHPTPIRKIATMTGQNLPVEPAGCHRVLPARIADAANYILKGDLTSMGTAAGDAIGRPAAAKTGTADNYMSAFFVGYTPNLVASVWVGNPTNPKLHPMMGYPGSCYRGGCPGFMYGSMAPGATWQMSFLHAALGAPIDFVPLSPTDPLFSLGNGIVSPTRPKPSHHHHHHHHGGGGGGGGGPGGGGGGDVGGGPGGGDVGGGPGGGDVGGGPGSWWRPVTGLRSGRLGTYPGEPLILAAWW